MTAQHLIDELGEDAAREESVAVGLIARIFALRVIANAATKDAEPLAAQLRQWLELEGRDELIDGEAELRAYLEPRSSTEWTVYEMAASTVLYLAAIPGMLSVNSAAFDALRKVSGAIELDEANKHRRLIQGSSYALQIKSTKSG